jgi:hypothetical protein
MQHIRCCGSHGVSLWRLGSHKVKTIGGKGGHCAETHNRVTKITCAVHKFEVVPFFEARPLEDNSTIQFMSLFH